MTEISFTSAIKPTTGKEFFNIIRGIPTKYHAAFPWTINDAVLSKDVYTTNICDCTSCLITDGKEALLMHLTPDTQSNNMFSRVLTFLRDHIDLKNPDLQAILVGSKKQKRSQDIYNKFTELLTNLNIPFSELKNSPAPVNIAYKTSTDEIYVSSSAIDKLLKKGHSAQQSLEHSFEKVKIADCDEIVG